MLKGFNVEGFNVKRFNVKIVFFEYSESTMLLQNQMSRGRVAGTLVTVTLVTWATHTSQNLKPSTHSQPAMAPHHHTDIVCIVTPRRRATPILVSEIQGGGTVSEPTTSTRRQPHCADRAHSRLPAVASEARSVLGKHRIQRIGRWQHPGQRAQ